MNFSEGPAAVLSETRGTGDVMDDASADVVDGAEEAEVEDEGVDEDDEGDLAPVSSRLRRRAHLAVTVVACAATLACGIGLFVQRADVERLNGRVAELSGELDSTKSALAKSEEEVRERDEAIDKAAKLVEQANASVASAKTSATEQSEKLSTELKAYAKSQVESAVSDVNAKLSDLKTKVDTETKTVSDLEAAAKERQSVIDDAKASGVL